MKSKEKLLIILFAISSTICFSQTMIQVSPTDTRIQIVGRTNVLNANNVEFAYPGISIKAKFQGTRIDAVLLEGGNGSATSTNYFNVIIDGGNPTRLQLSGTQTVYTLASGLSTGEHTVELFKRTESLVGTVTFQGFRIESTGTLLSPDALPTRKIEFIGNSITCGYGNEVSTTDPNSFHFTSVNENNYKAWGAVAARSLNAQYSCIAYSGRGLYRNNSGATTGTMPLIYDQIIPDNASKIWNSQNYIPQVIVINLGTNDFSAETSNSSYTVDQTTFVNTYVSFIGKLRNYYPQASIICCVGVMMSDGYPAGANQWTRIQNYTKAVRDYMNNQGDSKVYYLKLEPQSSPYGEDWHPTAATDAQMASTLVSFINSNIDWGTCPSVPTVTSPITFTQNDIATALTATGTALKWYTQETGGTALASAPTPSTLSIGTTSYYVSQTVDGCESERAKIDVNVIAFQNEPIDLKSGWNFIGCPIKGSTNIQTALSGIWQNVTVVKDFDGFWIADNPVYLNSLTTLRWGKGYMIKVTNDCQLIWE